MGVSSRTPPAVTTVCTAFRNRLRSRFVNQLQATEKYKPSSNATSDCRRQQPLREGTVSRRRKMAAPGRDEVSHSFLFVSRALLFLFGLLLLVSPWTEGYRLLDNFPSGQDSELNILALLAFLGLVLLITRSARRRLRSFLLLKWLWFLPDSGSPLFRASLHGHHSVSAAPPLIGRPPSAFNLPLQI